ncbi:OmpP1/FadL family transporter [Mucilaginibacter gracilis]|nr:outer membrane protein transport protein [Mucilaginibacter gracilis]
MRRILLIGLTLLPFLGMAQGFQVNLLGEKQIGMGHTGAALLQDGASVVFNPGAVAMLPQNYIQGGFSPLLFQSTFLADGSSQQVHNANKIATPFSGYAVWGPKQAPWKLGIGVYTPFGGLTDWGNTWQGRYALESLNLNAIYIQPTLSVKLASYLSIGAGFVYDIGNVDLTKAIPLASAGAADGQARLKGSGHGYGWNVGVYAKTEIGMTVGLTYRSQVDTKITAGNTTFTVPASLASSFPNGTFAASIPLPSTMTLGLGFYPTPKWTLAVDINYVDWKPYTSLDFTYSTTTSALQNTRSPRDYRDGFAFRGGAEYKATTKTALRFGGGYGISPVQDGYVTPEAPDANRYYVTAGLGLKVTTGLDLDMSFEYEHVNSRNQTNIESQLAGTFRTNVFIPGLGLVYHW